MYFSYIHAYIVIVSPLFFTLQVLGEVGLSWQIQDLIRNCGLIFYFNFFVLILPIHFYNVQLNVSLVLLFRYVDRQIGLHRFTTFPNSVCFCSLSNKLF